MLNPRHKRHLTTAVGAIALAGGLLASGTGAAAADTPDRDGAPAAHYTFQKVSFPTDPRFTQLLGINANNVIAGYHGDENTENTPNKGFTLKLPDKFTDENFPGSAQTQVVGINRDGQTVGFYVDQAANTHGFMKSPAREAVTVDLPGTTFNQLLGINDRDQAAGYFQDAAGLQHAYVHNPDGTFLVLNLPMSSSQATGINDNGTIVGFEQPAPTAATSSGYILRDGKLTVLNVPGSMFTQALGVNNHNEVVGTFTDANGMHGFTYQDGRYQTIDAPEATSTTINGVNDDGRLVGFFVNADQNTIGLVGDPTRRDA